MSARTRAIFRASAAGVLGCAVTWSGCKSAETSGPKGTGTAAHATAASVSNAASSSSKAAATVGSGGAPATFSCNPVSGEGCAKNEACDTDYADFAFVCYGGASTNALCADCGQEHGYCKPGSSCVAGKCVKFCCSDADCSKKAFCDKTGLAKFGKGVVGLCMLGDAGTGAGGAGGATGSGGAGGSSPPPVGPDCAAPVASASKGMCVPGFTGAGGSGGGS